VRLDKLLAEAGLGSRSDVQKRIRRGSVTVGGVVVRDPAVHAEPGAVAIDEVALAWPPVRHRILHKPAGVVTSTSDRDGPSILGCVPDPDRGWMPVGRLDQDVEGLLLLTLDGELAHRLTHPRHEVEKEYRAWCADPLKESDIDAFAAGLTLNDGPAAPADLRIDPDGSATVVVREGRYHQVKRMFAAVGNRVVRLVRVRMGPLSLPADLSVGSSRAMTESELAAIYAAVGLAWP
jgi:16S rRNA pseudouridine516 synthase